MEFLQLFITMMLTMVAMFGGLYFGVWIVNKLTRGKLFDLWR
jgi:uncharacterized protein YneF (UPF0154 family)